MSFLKGLVGAAKTASKIAGGVLAGGFGGNVGAGLYNIASKGLSGGGGGGGQRSAPAAVPAAVHTEPLAPGPPMSASSLDMARGQDKSRMKRQYGL
jgi:hypothetical protein